MALLPCDHHSRHVSSHSRNVPTPTADHTCMLPRGLAWLSADAPSCWRPIACTFRCQQTLRLLRNWHLDPKHAHSQVSCKRSLRAHAGLSAGDRACWVLGWHHRSLHSPHIWAPGQRSSSSRGSGSRVPSPSPHELQHTQRTQRAVRSPRCRAASCWLPRSSGPEPGGRAHPVGCPPRSW